MSEKPVTWMQQQFLNVLKDGEWHEAPAVITGSGIRGLLRRGLIERRNPNEHMFSWVRDGQFRLVRPVDHDRRMAESESG